MVFTSGLPAKTNDIVINQMGQGHGIDMSGTFFLTNSGHTACISFTYGAKLSRINASIMCSASN